MTILFLPVMINSKGPPAFSVSNFTIHFPFLSAIMVLACLLKRTSTFSLASAQPQTGIGLLRCITIPSENNNGIRTLALEQKLKATKRITRYFFIFEIYYNCILTIDFNLNYSFQTVTQAGFTVALPM